MTAQLRCAGCSHRFGKRSTGLLVLDSFVLCRPCANDNDVHRRLFFACSERHAPIEHASDNAMFISRGRAAQAVNSTKPAQ